MDRRSLGRTGLRVSALALGTVELGMDYGLRVPGAHGRSRLKGGWLSLLKGRTQGCGLVPELLAS